MWRLSGLTAAYSPCWRKTAENERARGRKTIRPPFCVYSARCLYRFPCVYGTAHARGSLDCLQPPRLARTKYAAVFERGVHTAAQPCNSAPCGPFFLLHLDFHCLPWLPCMRCVGRRIRQYPTQRKPPLNRRKAAQKGRKMQPLSYPSLHPQSQLAHCAVARVVLLVG